MTFDACANNHPLPAMNDQGDGSTLVKDQAFQSLLERMDEAADRAEQPWKSQAADSTVSSLPAERVQR